MGSQGHASQGHEHLRKWEGTSEAEPAVRRVWKGRSRGAWRPGQKVALCHTLVSYWHFHVHFTEETQEGVEPLTSVIVGHSSANLQT